MSELDEGGLPRPPAPDPAAGHSGPQFAPGPPPADAQAAEGAWLPPTRSRSRAERVREVLWAALIAVGIAALGAPLALLWSALGPHVDVVMTSEGPGLVDYNTEAFVAGDGRFALITAVVGALCGFGAWLLRRWRGPVLVIGLALGSLAGAWIMWKLGVKIGVEEYERLLQEAKTGQEFEQPMKLRAEGLVYLQALVAVVVYVVNAAWSRHPDLTEHDLLVSSSPSAPAAGPAEPVPPAGETASSPPA
jgi:hypothetical protein